MYIPIISDIIKGVSDYANKRQEIKAAVRERKDVIKEKALDAKLEGIRNGTEADIEMDKNRNSGWMDDVSFAVFLMPALLAFYPPAIPHIEAGFKALASMPLWYQYALGMMLVAVWGYRRLVTPIVEIVVKQYASVMAKRMGG